MNIEDTEYLISQLHKSQVQSNLHTKQNQIISEKKQCCESQPPPTAPVSFFRLVSCLGPLSSQGEGGRSK